ncbi:MAG: U32 family peptidase [Bacilli bacterium]|nr:U32 family peptidase [Bacilli bacterium]
MNKKELLVPVGDMNCLYQAVYHGADAVYLSGYQFGARKFAPNFSKEELVSAIKFCHLYGVKIYVTMNTLVKDDEVSSFLEQALFLHQNGVDALIVQDFGMICLLREKYPNLEIHASTQMNNSSLDTCELLYKLGVKRVVLSRELSIEEINNIKTPIEKEVFVHGALCISYSGRCLMSSMLGGRSGNRGECAGCCRMLYTLTKNNQIVEKNKYLLSTKEFNTIEYFQELLNSNIDSFKIEGRMKSPLYVAFITNLYRRIIDQEEVDLKKELDNLKMIFNRSFTKGRLFHEKDEDFLNTSSPNHIGLKIATAEPVKDKIKIVLDKNRKLCQNDAIRFMNQKKGMMVNYLYDEKQNLCNSSDNICYVDNKIDLKEKDLVSITQSYLLEKEYIKKEPNKKIPISFRIEAKQNHPLRITISDGNHTIEELGNKIEEAISSPTDKNTIIEKISKVGNTPFIVNNIEIDIDSNIFIQIKQLNELKRLLVEKLIYDRENEKKEVIVKEVEYQKEDNNSIIIEHPFTCSITTEEQLQKCLLYPFLRIYVSNIELYEKYKEHPNVILSLEKCGYQYQKLLRERNCTSDIFDYHNDIVYGDYHLNIMNSYTAYYMKKIGLKNIPLSCELNDFEMSQLIHNYQERFGKDNFEIESYGRIKNMIILGNILDLEENNYNYQLVDIKNRHFPVYYDGKKTIILNWEKVIKNDINVSNYIKKLDFYEETEKEIEQVLNIFNFKSYKNNE